MVLYARPAMPRPRLLPDPDAVFVGGGTPSYMDAEVVADLLTTDAVLVGQGTSFRIWEPGAFRAHLAEATLLDQRNPQPELPSDYLRHPV